MAHLRCHDGRNYWVAETRDAATGDHIQLLNPKGSLRLIYQRPHPEQPFQAEIVNPARFGLTHQISGPSQWEAIAARFLHAITG